MRAPGKVAIPENRRTPEGVVLGGENTRGGGLRKNSRFGAIFLLLFGIGVTAAWAVPVQDSELLEELRNLRAANAMLTRLVARQGARLEALEAQLAGPASTPTEPPPAAVSPPPTLESCQGPSLSQTQGPSESAASGPVPATKVCASPRKVTIHPYGYLRLDTIHDSGQAALEELLGYAASQGIPDARENDFYLTPKLTRLGLDLRGPEGGGPGGADLDGRVEIDFYRQYHSVDSRSELRMRHAFMRLTWGDSALIVGQTWDPISPLYPTANCNFGLWDGGNVGDRRPQVRFERRGGDASHGWLGQFAVSQAGSVSTAHGDEGLGVQARLELRRPFGGGTMKAGIWGYDGEEGIYESHLYGLDLSLPLDGDDLELRGEAFRGKNLDDFRGGVFQGVVAGQEVPSQGGWIELRKRTSWRDKVHVGWATDDPDDAFVLPGTALGSIVRSTTHYVGWRRKMAPLGYGFDLLHVETGYLGNPAGKINRLHAFLQYDF